MHLEFVVRRATSVFFTFLFLEEAIKKERQREEITREGAEKTTRVACSIYENSQHPASTNPIISIGQCS